MGALRAVIFATEGARWLHLHMTNRLLLWLLCMTFQAVAAPPGSWAEPPSGGERPGFDGRQRLLDDGVREIVFACRTRTRDPHWYANFGYYFDGPANALLAVSGALCKLDVASGAVTTILEDRRGAMRDPQVSYDGKVILFAYRRAGEPQYHLYTINKDGSGLKRLTKGIYDDIEPSFLPDGGIVFVSARAKRWVNCWQTQVATLYRCDLEGENIRALSANIEQDNTPWVLPDGRILYTRWEYVDRSQVRFHHLWTANPDGTGQMVYFGNMHPGGVFIDAKPIPGTNKIVFIHSPDHGTFEHAGHVAVVSGECGPDSWKTYKQISCQGGEDYRDPCAVADDCFLVARGRKLLVMDGAGNESVLLDAGTLVHEPRPLAARPRERVIPSRIDRMKTTGTAILNDVYRGRRMTGVRRGEIRKLLVLETLPKPLNFGNRLWDFIPISHGGTFTLARILGAVPVEEDGSAFFELPANRSLFFIAVDAANSSVKRMHSFLTVMPGESVGCVGCHENRTTPPSNEPPRRLAALKRAPSVIEPLPGVPYLHDYPRDIQPILDRHCVPCHEPDNPSGRVLLTGDHGGIFSVSYFTLISRRLVSDGRNRVGNTAPRGVGDSASPLMRMLDGSHHGARLPPGDIEMLRSWIHVGAPYAGTYAALGTGMVHGELPLPAGYGRVRDNARDAFQRRCEPCHQDAFPELNRYSISSAGHESLLDSHLAFNLSRPDKSPLLLAPLAPDAGGWGMPRRREDKAATGERLQVFKDTSDPDYRALLEYVEFGKGVLERHKRWDMPGFKPSPYYVREMKRYGVLPESFDLARDAIDAHEVDRRYWESFRYDPENPPKLYANRTVEKLLLALRADPPWETDLSAKPAAEWLANADAGSGRRYEGESGFRIVGCTRGKAYPQDLRRFGRGWSGGSHLLWAGGDAGDSLRVEFDVETRGVYAIRLQFTKAADYGIFQLYMDGKKLLGPMDLHAARVKPSPLVEAGTVVFEKGAHELRIEAVGASSSARAGGFGKHLFGLDYMTLEDVAPQGTR